VAEQMDEGQQWAVAAAASALAEAVEGPTVFEY
jgi:hypothetical protein